MQDLTRRMATGVVWMTLAKVVDRSIGLVSTLILARLLTPGDFGLASMAMAIMGALQLLGAFSFDMALIQNPNAGRQHYDTVWTIGVLFGLFLAAALLVLAYPAGLFFNEPRLPAIMAFLAFMALIGGLVNVGTVAFRKEMRFDREFQFLLARRLVLFAVTVTLAYAWRDYWALVVGTLTGTVIGVLISYAMHPYRPRFSLQAWTELFSFSRWMFINNTIGFLYSKAADFIVAKILGTTALGYYNVAFEVANLPSTELQMPISRAVFPGYAKMTGDLRQLRQGYFNVMSMLALFAIPAAVGLGCVASSLVNVMLGDKWISAVPLIQVLAIQGLLTAMMTCGNYVFLALGKPRHVTLLLGAYVCVAVPMLCVGASWWGLQGVAWMLLTASVLLVPLNYSLLSSTLGVRIRDLVVILWRPIVGTIVMFALLFWVRGHLAFGPGLPGKIGEMLTLVVLGAVTYGLVVLILWLSTNRTQGPESFLWEQVMSRLEHLRR